VEGKEREVCIEDNKPQYERNLNRSYGPVYKEFTIKRLLKPTLWVIDETQLSTNKGPYPTHKEEGVIRTEEERHTMTLGVCSGVPVDEEFGFSEEETVEVSLEEVVERGEEDLEGARVARDVELRKETVVVFTEYRNYNRMELTTKRG
jgi:hypothetical protein